MTYFDMSPDGSQIVYSTCRYPDSDRLPPSELESWEFSYEIVVSNIDGTNTRRLTNNNHFDNFPVWSPDGSQIAFVSDSDPDHDASEIRGRLIVYTMSTGESRDITPFYGDKDRVAPHPPAWSPDGQSIAFVAYDGDDAEYDYRGDVRSQGYPFVHTVLVDGRGSRTIGRAFSEPSWSPDGARIAVVSQLAHGAGLFTFASDSSDISLVTHIMDHVWDMEWLHRVHWSPDGSRILFAKTWGGDLPAPLYVEDNRCRYLCVASADGAFVTATSGLRLPSLYDPVRGQLGILSNPTNLLLHEPLSWSPDGSRIAVLTRTAGGRGSAILYTMDRNGNDVQVLVRNGENWDLIAWRSEPVDLDSCSNGVVVPDPEENPGLVEDCRTLLSVMDTLGGSVALELSMGWRTDRPIEEWGSDPDSILSVAAANRVGVVVGGDPPRVRSLVLPGARTIDSGPIGVLFGRIPTELGNLSELRELDLGVNELTGPIPAELGNLSNLEVLDLTSNYLRGGIPSELGKLTNLEILRLSDNDLGGPIPPELGNLSNLRELYLENNQLTGNIPPELGKLTNLKELYLDGNQLTGPIPPELGNLPNLEKVYLGRGNPFYNRFTGCVPMALVDKIVYFGELGLPPCEESSNDR